MNKFAHKFAPNGAGVRTCLLLGSASWNGGLKRFRTDRTRGACITTQTDRKGWSQSLFFVLRVVTHTQNRRAYRLALTRTNGGSLKTRVSGGTAFNVPA